MEGTRSGLANIFAFDSTLPYDAHSLVTSGRDGGGELYYLLSLS